MAQSRRWLSVQFEKLWLMPDYFRALAKQWLNILFGETLVGIAFLLWWALGVPTNNALVVVFVSAMFVAGYYAWRADHGRLQKRIDITRLRTQEWQEEVHHARAYYFEILNRSEGATIENVSVQLNRIVPEVHNLDWLPIPLRLKHDNPAAPTPYQLSCDLNPGEPRNIDLVAALDGNTRFSISHAVAGINDQVIFDTEGHRLQVIVTARDMPALYLWFKVWRDVNGVLVCEMESEAR